MSKPQWICVVCGEDFTRKSSAKRHGNNINLHREKPIIVRYIDYIIARVKGDYPQPIIPSRLQRTKINKMHEPYEPGFTHDYNNTFDTRAISSSGLDHVSHLNVPLSMTNDIDSKNHPSIPIILDNNCPNQLINYKSLLVDLKLLYSPNLKRLGNYQEHIFNPKM